MTNEPLTEDELVAALKNEAEASCAFYDTTLADRQERCIKYYDAEPFGDEMEGMSQIVLPDVAEAVDYMTISVLRAFVSGDRVVEFQAKEDGQEQAVDEATEAVHQLFMQEQDGFRVLHDWLKSGLVEIIGIVKTAMVEEDSVAEQEYLADAETLAFAPEEAAITDNGDGTYRVVAKVATKRRRYYDYTLPSEEFRFSARARHEDKADYLAHVCTKTRSDLIEMGFDADTVADLPVGEDTLLSDSRRDARDEGDTFLREHRHASMQEVELWEEYIRIDADGDGVAELLKCFRVGERLLSQEIVEDHPFTVFCPFPRPHRMVGDSLAEKAMDIQRIRSIVARQLMNGMYLSNMPRYWLPSESDDGVNTVSDLLTVIPGSPVRGRGPAPTPLNAGFDVSKSLGVLEFWSGERESRTGITRMNQGLDADTLNKTATGTALMQAQGQQYEEFIARNFAECVARLFWRKYRLLKASGEPFTVKIGGSFAQVDPSQWPDEPDMYVRTGLGTNRREYRIAQRMQLLSIQKEGLAIGLTDKRTLFNAASGLVRDMAIGQPDDYFVDPAQQGEEQPDPAMAEAEAKMAIERQKLEQQAQLAREKMQIDREIALMRLQAESQLKRLELGTEAMTGVDVPDDSPGGSLTA